MPSPQGSEKARNITISCKTFPPLRIHSHTPLHPDSDPFDSFIITCFFQNSRLIILLRFTPFRAYILDLNISSTKMRQFIAVFVFLFTTVAAADPLDDAIALMRRQNNDTTSSIPPISTLASTIQTTIDVETTSTFTPPPSVSTFTSFSTITPTNSEGSVTTTETSAFTSAATSQASFTQIKSSVTQEIVTTFTTESDGSTIIGTRTSSTVIPTTTEVDAATLRGGDNGGGSSGLSPSTKKTIGGVVGGVGGALLLAGLAYTAWRIWGKKKNLHDDDLYDPNVQQEKLSTSTDTQNTPFRNNLEQYHQPGPVNTASNF